MSKNKDNLKVIIAPAGLSINEAAAKGIDRLRLDKWANPMDHIKIDIIMGGEPGPWVHLFSPANRYVNGSDPKDILGITIDYDAPGWRRYAGPLPDSDEYKAVAARWRRPEILLAAGGQE